MLKIVLFLSGIIIVHKYAPGVSETTVKIIINNVRMAQYNNVIFIEEINTTIIYLCVKL